MADATLDFFFKFFELWLRGKKNFWQPVGLIFFIFYRKRKSYMIVGELLQVVAKITRLGGNCYKVVFKRLFCPYFDFFDSRIG